MTFHCPFLDLSTAPLGPRRPVPGWFSGSVLSEPGLCCCRSLLLNRRIKWPKGMESKGEPDIQTIRRNTNHLVATVRLKR